MDRQMVAGQAMQTGMRILQASTLELKQLVTQALAANPMLEEVPDGNADPLVDETYLDVDAVRADGWREFTAEGRPSPEAAARRDFMYESVVAPESLKAHLMVQVEQASLSGKVRDAVVLLIDALDDRGFLVESPEDIEEHAGISKADMKTALDMLHEMEPAGVGARDLQDSLMIQLSARKLVHSLAFKLVKHCWNELARHKYEAAASALNVTTDEVGAALEVIRSLSPDPGAAYAPGSNPHLLPDIVVEETRNGRLEVSLTSEYLPRLAINEQYMEMMSESSDNREVRQYLRHAFREGQDLIKALDMRQETILRLARVIVSRQKEFFKRGPSRLTVMGMEEVAEEMGVHVSTVSRACRDKYLLCKWGLRELRSFFKAGVSSAGGAGIEGESVASAAVQELMKSLIASESPSKPLSDARLALALQEKGLNIARRTVAKYREQMKILPASLRKRL